MNKFKLTIKRKGKGGKTIIDNEILKLPNKPEEFTLSQWVNFHLIREQTPAWFKSVESKNEEGRSEIVNTWDQQRWVDYFYWIAKQISCFCDKNIYEILEGVPSYLTESEGSDSLMAMYILTLKPLAEYQGKERTEFIHKKKRFRIPETIKGMFDQKTHGPNLTMMETIDALQVEHVMNQKDENGNLFLEDARYHTDIGLITALCREVLPDGTLEKLPLDYQERKLWFEERMNFFSDISMDKALDVRFFLTSSKRRFLKTLILASSLKTLHLQKSSKKASVPTK